MKKVKHTKELDYIFLSYRQTKIVYMDLTEHSPGEIYLKVVNRKRVLNVYLLEDSDDAKKIDERIKAIYAKISKSNVYHNSRPFEEIMKISQELTKNTVVPRSVPVGLYQEDSFFQGIFVAAPSTGDYKKDCNYISVLPNGKKFHGYYNFEKYDTIREITKKIDDSNTYYLICEEVVTKDYQEAIKHAKIGDRVEVSNEIFWDIQEFENFYYKGGELLSKDDYLLTYDSEIIDNCSAVYCEDVEDYMHCDSAYYLRNEDIYYAQGVELTYSELEGTYILDYDVVYVIDAQGHEQPIHYASVGDYFYDEVTGMYYTEEHCNHSLIIQAYGKTELLPVSSGKKDYFIGIELEMELEGTTIGERNDNIINVLDEIGGDYSPLLEWKNDGSLKCGVEMVTAPISLEIFKGRIIPIVKKLHETGFTSEDGGRCGNHIHISKNVFSEEEQSRLVLIYAKFEQQVKILSRRGTNNSYCRDVLDNNTTLEVGNSMKIAVDQKNKSRLTAINFSNSETIEFRVFRGTMNVDTLIANIQLVQLFADWSRKKLTVYEILNLTIEDFKNEILCNNYEELLNYCIKKEVI